MLYRKISYFMLIRVSTRVGQDSPLVSPRTPTQRQQWRGLHSSTSAAYDELDETTKQYLINNSFIAVHSLVHSKNLASQSSSPTPIPTIIPYAAQADPAA
jgi:hypothetical protein